MAGDRHVETFRHVVPLIVWKLLNGLYGEACEPDLDNVEVLQGVEFFSGIGTIAFGLEYFGFECCNI